MDTRACRRRYAVKPQVTRWVGKGRKCSLLMKVLLIPVCLGWFTYAAGADSERLMGKVLINGQSTLHDWSCASFEASLNLPAGADLGAVHAFFRQIMEDPPDDRDHVLSTINTWVDEGVRLIIAIPVDSLDCGSRGLERDLRRAVRAEKYPVIACEFRQVHGLEVRNNPDRPVVVLHTEGEIELAGRRRPIQLDVYVEWTEQEVLRFHAGRNLLMTDFDVSPPSAFLGLLRAKDRFHFHYEFVLAPTGN